MLTAILGLALVGGIVYIVTKQKTNLETGVHTETITLLETTNLTKAQLVAKKAISLEENGQTTDYLKEGTTEVWLTESDDPMYDTTIITVEEES